jgi:hypothetical protein
MGFRFGRARDTAKTASYVAPPPSTSPPSLRNKRAWLSTNSRILSKDVHGADHGGLPFPSFGLTSSPSALSRSASVQSSSLQSPPPPPPRDNNIACHPQLAVQHRERAWSSPTLQQRWRPPSLRPMVGRMATMVLRRSPCSKNWKPYKIETKDIGIQAYDAILQLGVGYHAMA